jgi:hypothetical protein
MSENMSERKYEFTGETKEECGTVLRRIRAIKDFGAVKKGEIGGWIADENNLSHTGDAWVSDNAWVYDNAQVSDNARVYGNAWVYGNARVSGNAWVYGYARVSGNARVSGTAQVFDNAWVSGTANIRTCRDMLTVGPIGSRNGHTTFYRLADGNIGVACGRFAGTIDAFLKKVSETHGENEHAAAYKLAAELAKMRIFPESEEGRNEDRAL